MKLRKIDHVGINVIDLAAAKAFFLDFGLEVLGEWESEGEQLDQIVGLEGVKTAAVMMRTPDGQANIELVKFYTPADKAGIQPAAANMLGISHIAFLVEDIDAVVARLKKHGSVPFSEVQAFGDTYRMCYVHGPEGIILELAEEINK